MLRNFATISKTALNNGRISFSAIFPIFQMMVLTIVQDVASQPTQTYFFEAIQVNDCRFLTQDPLTTLSLALSLQI